MNIKSSEIKLKNIFGDLTGGALGAVIALPQALAFGVAIGTGASSGLWGAIILCFTVGLLGCNQPLLSGPTGPAAIVCASALTVLNGSTQSLFAVIFLAGLFQIILSRTNLTQIVKYVPYPVISGFMNAVGVILIILQLNPFLGAKSLPTPMLALKGFLSALQNVNESALLIGILTLTIIFATPRYITKIIPSQILALVVSTIVSALYNFDLIDTFALFDVSRLSQEADRNLSITDTSNRYAFLTILGIDSGYITSIQSLTASYTEDINTLMFILNFTNGTRFVTTISEFGEATSETVEAYLDNGGSYYQPSGDFEAVRNAFINHNYTQLVYDASNNVIGHYYFTQRYYAAVYDDTSYATYNDAYFAANNDTLTFLNADGSVYSTLELYGVYNAVISYDSATQSNYIIPIYQRAWNSETDNLPEVMFYPSLASMFSHFSFYTFNEVEQCYYSDDVALALDLYTRFFLNYEEEGYRVELLGSGFNYTKDASGNMDQISLKIFFALNGSDPYYYECVFEDFNETAYEPFEKFMENMTYSLS